MAPMGSDIYYEEDRGVQNERIAVRKDFAPPFKGVETFCNPFSMA